jgi:transposase
VSPTHHRERVPAGGLVARTARITSEARDQPTRRRYSAAYKIAILAEYDSLDRDGKGNLLQREGLYTSLLSQWRKQRDRGARTALDGRPGRLRAGPAERELAQLRARAEQLEAELERARKVLETQRMLLDELGPEVGPGRH